MKCYQCRYWDVPLDWRPRNDEEDGPEHGAPCTRHEPELDCAAGHATSPHLIWPYTYASDGCWKGRRIPVLIQLRMWLMDVHTFFEGAVWHLKYEVTWRIKGWFGR